MKALGDMGVKLSEFLIPAVYGGDWSVSSPARLTPGRRAAGTDDYEDDCASDFRGRGGEEKSPSPTGNQILLIQPVASCTSPVSYKDGKL